MFNALKFSKKLEEAGFSRQQAEAQLLVISEIVEDDLVTKGDLQNLETKLLNAIEATKNYLEKKINNLESKMEQLEYKMERLEYRMTIKLGTLLVVGFTAVASLMKFWMVR